ncbi:hypothetical protein PLICBS_010160 [Purpureocillium lilacinum]|uniref:uncharacterized protein n=1 Tax=Purpureocillium lilacinum TaxID=33203 RepID=UPI00208402BB|nr:hypothetical protein PLICBS_010160 [Purpureocillium lilacinum]
MGGTRLRWLGEELRRRGLAQENLGAIDAQTIAGAVSTGTHGTGPAFGSLATQLAGLTLVTASGALLECSPEQDADIFKAAQVSLGMLGIIVKVKLRVVPAALLHYHERRGKLSETLRDLERHKQKNDHFEFYWFPYTDRVQARYLNRTNSRHVNKHSCWRRFNQFAVENYARGLLSEMCRLVPSFCKVACRLSGRCVATVDEINYGHRLFPAPRLVRFHELEYSVPAEHAITVLRQVQRSIQEHRFAVNLPVQCRFVSADDIWLSPAYRRDTAYIAVHMYRGMPHEAYFCSMQDIFKKYSGRPHWGKMHTCTASELRALYPRWEDFQRVRRHLDPEGIFLNEYLRTLFGTDGAVCTTL